MLAILRFFFLRLYLLGLVRVLLRDCLFGRDCFRELPQQTLRTFGITLPKQERREGLHDTDTGEFFYAGQAHVRSYL